MRIGILALQGAFIEHEKMFYSLGADTFEIRQKSDILKSFDGIILPGGESTVQGKLLHELELFEPLRKMIENNFPVFGTCAGLVLLAKKIENDTRVHFASMDIKAVRNAYGRQLGSFETVSEFKGIGNIPMIFIRAPYIASASENVTILAKTDNKITAARQDNKLVTAFHPELSSDTRVHNYFLNMIKSS